MFRHGTPGGSVASLMEDFGTYCTLLCCHFNNSHIKYDAEFFNTDPPDDILRDSLYEQGSAVCRFDSLLRETCPEQGIS